MPDSDFDVYRDQHRVRFFQQFKFRKSHTKGGDDLKKNSVFSPFTKKMILPEENMTLEYLWQFPMTHWIIGALAMWAFLTLVPQLVTDFFTKQDRLAIGFVALGVVVFSFWVLPQLTLSMLIGTIVTLVLIGLAIGWFYFFNKK